MTIYGRFHSQEFPNVVTSFVGQLKSGKSVRVRRLKRDTSTAPIAYAVYADRKRAGRMELVARFHDPLLPGHRSGAMFCANGYEHGRSACCWTRVPEGERVSPLEAAGWNAHWWTHVVDKTAEVVVLRPAGRDKTAAEPPGLPSAAGTVGSSECEREIATRTRWRYLTTRPTELVREQTRHDVAASVARHAELEDKP